MGTRWWESKRRILLGNTLAVALILSTLGFCLSVAKGWPEALTLSLFLIPIVVCAYLGGLWPGLFATFLSCLVSDYFLIEPRHSLRIASPSSELYLVELAGIGLLASVLVQLLHRRGADDSRGSDHSLRVAEWKIWGSSVAGLALLLVVTIASYREVEALHDRDAWVDHSHQVISSIRRVQSLVTEAISAQRGYLIGGDDRYLLTYATSTKDLQAELSILRRLIADNPDQVDREEELEGYISDRLAVFRGIVELRKTKGLAAAQAAIAGGEGRPLEQIIVVHAAEMEKQEWLLLKGRQKRAQKTASYCRTVIVLGSLFAFGIAVTALSLIAQDFAGSRRASRELQEYRDQLEQRVLERTAELREAQRIAHMGRWHLNPETGETAWGEEIYRIFGIDPALPAPAYEQLKSLLTPESFRRMDAAIEVARRTGAPYHIDLELNHADGGTRWIATWGQTLRDGGGRVTELLGTVQDITERKTAEEALRQSLERLERVLDVQTVGVMFWDLNTGCMLDANNAFLTLMGYTRREVEARELTWQKLTPPEYMDVSRAEVQKFLASGRVGPYEKEYFCKDGTKRWLLFAGSSLGNNQCVEFCVDISDRKQAEEKLRQQATLLDLAHDAIIVRGLDGRILLWNRGATDTYGFSAEDAVGKISQNLLKTVFPISLKDIQSSIAQTREWEGELRHTRADGRQITVASRWSLLRDAQSHPTSVLEINRDVTERKQAEEALRKIEWMLTEKEAEDPLHSDTLQVPMNPPPPYGDLTQLNSCRLILDSVGKALLQEITSDFMDLLGTSAAIFEKNGDYAFGAFSSGWCRTLDSASRELCNSPSNCDALASGKWLCRDSCWNRSAAVAMAKGAAADAECSGGVRIYSVPIVAGAEIIGAMSFGYGDPPRDENELRELSAKYGVPVEELRRHADSYETRPAFIIEMAKKRLATAANLVGEIVQRKRAESELEEKAKDLAKSNDELAQFAFVASHDLQEPLRKISAFGDLLASQSENALDEQGRDYLQRMQNAAQRMSQLIESLLELSRVTSKTRTLEVVDLNNVVSGVVSDLEIRIHQTGGRVEVGDLPTVMADRLQMRQLFQNLIGNALKFHKHDVPPIVRIHSQQNGKDAWEIHVADNGIGFDEQYLARIFRPFQRLHARTAFEGSGMGLAICNKIVVRHSGQITAHSQPGIGSDFVVLLPHTNIAKEAKAS